MMLCSHFHTGMGNSCSNLISLQVHGSIVAFQGQSHRDWFELLGLSLSRFAKWIQSLDFEIKIKKVTNLMDKSQGIKSNHAIYNS